MTLVYYSPADPLHTSAARRRNHHLPHTSTTHNAHRMDTDLKKSLATKSAWGLTLLEQITKTYAEVSLKPEVVAKCEVGAVSSLCAPGGGAGHTRRLIFV